MANLSQIFIQDLKHTVRNKPKFKLNTKFSQNQYLAGKLYTKLLLFSEFN